ncbi:P-loop containing nucleoside triphosphate hydrolase protein [Rozella allomycis CSF55]|uniref:P-loop containing nucleoside triphosphate hydrolase protein n=1 Tax=Rozella allomycis (strain CSF55) TaxID=988480 RepID=A0A4P9YPD0_ROZAC|nr:P-loop containing nucleoside triphosphate hydrolase protein [Rozella allomycis CSF55]
MPFDHRNECAFEKAGFISRIFYTWTNAFVNYSWKNNLMPSDFPPVDAEMEAHNLLDRFETAWNKEKAKSNPSLIRAVWSVFKWRHLLTGFYGVLESVFKISGAVLLGFLLKWLKNNNGDILQGWLIVGFLCASMFLYGIVHHVLFFSSYRLGVFVRITLSAAIYEKTLKMSTSSSTSTGKIINIVSNDVQVFDMASHFAHFLYVGPIEVLISYGFLVYWIGWLASSAGLIVIFLMLPLQWGFAKRFSKLREKMVTARDDRVRILSDLFHGIMIVKYYSWEEPFLKYINEIRNKETRYLFKASWMKAMNEALFFASPVMISLVSFGTAYLAGEQLEPSSIFSSLALLNVIRLTMTNFFPLAVESVSASLISLERIREILVSPEIGIENAEESDEDLIVENASFSWGVNSTSSVDDKMIPMQEHSVALRDLDFKIRQGELCIVIGTFGSGKSSLLLSIMEELKKISGCLKKPRRIRYASQKPWILSGSIKENILFGQTYDEEEMNRVIEGCALKEDLLRFDNGLETMIGEQGCNLSGGQKARISLARAIYKSKDVDLILLDDVMSAVDNKVANMCVLATHQWQFVEKSDKVLVLDKSKQTFFGGIEEFYKWDNLIVKSVIEYKGSRSKQEENEIDKDEIDFKGDENERNEIIKEEDRNVGSVSGKTYKYFAKNGGGLSVVLFLVFALSIGQASIIISDRWLAIWSESVDQENSMYIIVYFGLFLIVLIFSIIRSVTFFRFCLKSSCKIFELMLGSAMGSNLNFYQSNPHGRILNRFTKDQSQADEELPTTFFDAIQCVFIVLGVIIVICYVNYWLIITLPFILFSFLYVRKIYLKSSREIKRLEAISRSPIYSHLSITLQGLPIIRSSKMESNFKNTFLNFINENSKCYFAFIFTARWLGIRLDLLSSLFFTVSVIVCVLIKDKIDPGLVGLGLAYVMQLISLVQWCTRQLAEVENLMTCIERMLVYTKLPQENWTSESNIQPPPNWPQNGQIEFNNMSLSYPESKSPALSNINCIIKSKQKVGIVGTTGAGKSSFVTSLFRFIESTPENSISIDNIPIQKIDLKTLRQSLSIIPQESFLFKGTVRQNLDPFNLETDSNLWRVLQLVQLEKLIKSFPNKLDQEIHENGSNLSIGERQLICLARAILRKPKILIMDEATANIDSTTSNLIQNCIHQEFANCTVLTIAHRLKTVMHCDLILVLDKGQIVESGSPSALLEANGAFKKLCDELNKSID